MRFDAFPLHETTHAALEAMGFEETTPVQEQTLPALLDGRDVIAQAQTGTGKTAAFGIPLVEAGRAGRRGLVLTPTRELAQQVQRELQAIAKNSPVDVVCLIGGASFGDQVRALKRHPDAVLVATPGRVVDHLGRGTLRLDGMAILVLDEADEMLSMGFQEELDAIVDAFPTERQTMLFTATLPPAIERLASAALNEPVTVRAGGKQRGAAESVRQGYALVKAFQRGAAVRRIIDAEDPKAALLFCRTRQRTTDLAEELADIGAEALHGGMGQPVRDAVMQRFRSGRTRVLVATDVAARGLDVEDIELVLHDDLAADVETYIHRVGRTGRAGRTGTSILMIAPGAVRRLNPVQRRTGQLERYELPTDAELAELRTARRIEDLMAIEPGDDAARLLAAAEAQGLELRDVALRALEMLAAADSADAVDAPDAVRGITSGARTTDGGDTVVIALKLGTIDRTRPADIVGLLTGEAGLQGQDVGRIDILEKMSVVEVPAEGVEHVLAALERAKCRGQWVRPRLAEGWRFKAKRA